MELKRPYLTTVEEAVQRQAVRELVEFERYCRDNRKWEEMKSCFTQDSVVTISWYQGSGFGFVEASRNMAASAPHRIYNTVVELCGSRAIAVMMTAIEIRKTYCGVACDLSSKARLVYRLERLDEQWYITSMDCIYEKDSLIPCAPAGIYTPSGVRESYANLSASLAADGYSIADDLPGDDRLELVHTLMEKTLLWCAGGNI